MTREQEYDCMNEIRCTPRTTIHRQGNTPAPALATEFPYSVTPLRPRPTEVQAEPVIEVLWTQKVQSETRENVSYTVVMFTDGKQTCDCPAGSRDRHCKHLGWAERQQLAYENSPDFAADELVAEAAPDYVLSHADALEVIERVKRAEAAGADLFGPEYRAA